MHQADSKRSAENVDHEVAEPRMPSGHEQLGGLDRRSKQRESANLRLPAPVKAEHDRDACEGKNHQVLDLV
jgi:hypothetical protein